MGIMGLMHLKSKRGFPGPFVPRSAFAVHVLSDLSYTQSFLFFLFKKPSPKYPSSVTALNINTPSLNCLQSCVQLLCQGNAQLRAQSFKAYLKTQRKITSRFR